jgi:hypothetical protein
VGVTYAGHTFTATGGNEDYTFVLHAGELPNGLTLDAGVLSGTPTTTDTFVYTIRVTDTMGGIDEHEFTQEILPALALDTTNPSTGQVGVTYIGHTFTASGGNEDYTFSLHAGDLPDGLALDDGVLSGTPGVADTFTYTIRVTDGMGATSDHEFAHLIIPPLAIVTTDPAAGQVGLAYGGHTFTATNGDGDYGFSHTAGDLPNGLSFDETTGTITGTPSVADTFTYTIRAMDGMGATSDHEFTHVVLPALAIGTTWTDTTSGKVDQMGIALDRTVITTSRVVGDTTYQGERAWRIDRTIHATFAGTGTAEGQPLMMEGSSKANDNLFVGRNGTYLGGLSTTAATIKVTLVATGMEVDLTQSQNTTITRVK